VPPRLSNRSTAGRKPPDWNRQTVVNALKRIYLTFIRMVKQVRQLPKTIADAAEQRQKRALGRELEIERLDRIRNPSKYRGK